LVCGLITLPYAIINHPVPLVVAPRVRLAGMPSGHIPRECIGGVCCDRGRDGSQYRYNKIQFGYKKTKINIDN